MHSMQSQHYDVLSFSLIISILTIILFSSLSRNIVLSMAFSLSFGLIHPMNQIHSFVSNIEGCLTLLICILGLLCLIRILGIMIIVQSCPCESMRGIVDSENIESRNFHYSSSYSK